MDGNIIWERMDVYIHDLFYTLAPLAIVFGHAGAKFKVRFQKMSLYQFFKSSGCRTEVQSCIKLTVGCACTWVSRGRYHGNGQTCSGHRIFRNRFCTPARPFQSYRFSGVFCMQLTVSSLFNFLGLYAAFCFAFSIVCYVFFL